MTHHFFLAPLALLIAVGCGGSSETNDGLSGQGGTGGATDGGVGGTTQLQGLGFDLALNYGDAGSFCGLKDCTNATMFIRSASADTLYVVFGQPSYATEAQLQRSGTSWNLISPVTIAADPQPFNKCLTRVDLTAMSFDIADHDTDGRIDVTAEGTFERWVCSDDNHFTNKGSVSVTGAPDSTIPSMSVSDNLDPIAPLRIAVSEPMEATSTASMAPESGGPSFPLAPVQESGVVVGFTSDVVFPLGSTLTATSSSRDLPGFGSPTSLPATFLPDPGVMPQDGFESNALHPWAQVRGAPQIVGSYETLSPLAGAQMVYLPGGGKALIHLVRTSGASAVKLNVRKMLEKSHYSEGDLNFTAAVVGGTQRSTKSVAMGDPLETITLSGGDTIRVGPVQEIILPLTELGADVLFEMEAQSVNMSFSRVASALIDDIRTE